MERYIDADALYKREAAFEEQALECVSKLNEIPFEEMTEKEKSDWIKWSAILAERTAFKFDVADAPSADVRKNIRGKWKQGYCSECGYNWGKDAPIARVPNFCPNCGADMRERREDG